MSVEDLNIKFKDVSKLDSWNFFHKNITTDQVQVHPVFDSKVLSLKDNNNSGWCVQ